MAKFEQVAKLLGTNNPQVVIAASVAALVKAGFAADVALDMVCGEGTFNKLAGEIWEVANAK